MMISETHESTMGRSEAQAIFAMMQHTRHPQPVRKAAVRGVSVQMVAFWSKLAGVLPHTVAGILPGVFQRFMPQRSVEATAQPNPISHNAPKHTLLPTSGCADSERRASSGQCHRDSGFLAVLDQMGARHQAAAKADALRRAFLEEMEGGASHM